jgi:hypothetical protein
MKRNLLFILTALLTAAGLHAQTVSTFESLALPADTFWNGSDTSGGFTDGNAFFANDYNTQWSSWSGFAYSSKTDTVTAGFANMYSCIAGKGYNGSATYGVAYVSSFGNSNYIGLRNGAKAHQVSGFYINNSTYAYLSMLNGDAYAKKFGGASGNDPDWFRLKITGYLNGAMTDTVEFYLADFRFTDNSKDYIIKEWKWVDLTSLGNVDSLVFAMSSSDVGKYGMNTPAYFCIDDLTTTDGVGFGDISVTGNELKLWPNPANSFVNISGDFQKAEIIDANGRVVGIIENNGGSQMRIDISDMTSGIYFLRFQSAENILVKKLIVR